MQLNLRRGARQTVVMRTRRGDVVEMTVVMIAGNMARIGIVAEPESQVFRGEDCDDAYTKRRIAELKRGNRR